MGKLYTNGCELSSNVTIPELSLDEFTENTYARPIISADAEATFECESAYINPFVLNKMLGIDHMYNPNLSMGFTVTFKNTKQVQNRRHRKKRINKKWAKRYGFHTVATDVAIRDCSLISRGEDMTIIGRSNNFIYGY